MTLPFFFFFSDAAFSREVGLEQMARSLCFYSRQAAKVYVYVGDGAESVLKH